MDSGTHVVMGVGLYALAFSDPVVAQSPPTAEAVMLGTLIGSVIPDIDTVLKVKNNAVYIRNHRGFTHSIPATCLWPLILTGSFLPFFPEANFLHFWIWTFIAVFLHVFVDIFNAYGTQALRPLTNKWIALEIINIFDPVLFFSHIAGFAIWYLFGYPAYIFGIIYAGLVGYYIWRYIARERAEKSVKDELGDVKVYLSPTIRWSRYHLAAKSETTYFVGEVVDNQVQLIHKFDRAPLPDNEWVEKAKKDKNLSAFLSFSPIYRWEIEHKDAYTDVRFIDLRYLTSGRHYPFVAVVHMDENGEIQSSYTGWIYSEEKLQKKLSLATSEE